MKEWIVADSQIKQWFEDHVFSTKLNVTERRTWEAFESVCRNFIRNKKAENYSEILQKLISSYSAVRYNLPFKLHILHSHLVFSPLKNWAASPMNIVKGSIRTYTKMKRGIVENGVQICGLITARVL